MTARQKRRALGNRKSRKQARKELRFQKHRAPARK